VLSKYLGVTIDNRTKWIDHIKQIAGKATKVKVILHRNFHQRPPTIKCSIYKAIVCPILQYSSTVRDLTLLTTLIIWRLYKGLQQECVLMILPDFLE